MSPSAFVQQALVAASDAPMQISVGGGSSAVKLFLLMTALSFAAGALISITSFTRIIIVMSFLRQALGTPSLPPNQVVVALSLALTGFVMAPTFTKVNKEALTPYLEDQITGDVALERGSAPVLQFLLRQTRPDDLRLFYELSGTPRPTRAEE
ncbi:MAG TPA: flagellar biosynthetic protein FliP, partial [Archangium sp.]